MNKRLSELYYNKHPLTVIQQKKKIMSDDKIINSWIKII